MVARVWRSEVGGEERKEHHEASCVERWFGTIADCFTGRGEPRRCRKLRQEVEWGHLRYDCGLRRKLLPTLVHLQPSETPQREYAEGTGHDQSRVPGCSRNQQRDTVLRNLREHIQRIADSDAAQDPAHLVGSHGGPLFQSYGLEELDQPHSYRPVGQKRQ